VKQSRENWVSHVSVVVRAVNAELGFLFAINYGFGEFYLNTLLDDYLDETGDFGGYNSSVERFFLTNLAQMHEHFPFL
jgi:hypothetical protein